MIETKVSDFFVSVVERSFGEIDGKEVRLQVQTPTAQVRDK